MDTSRAVIGGAEVIAVNEATHAARSVTTTSEGVFRVALLPPGMYEISAKGTGFATHTVRAIQVRVSETTSVDVTLTVAGVSQTMQVDDKASLADLESSTLGGLVDRDAVQELPLSSRNYTQILGLSPGVVADLPTTTVLGNGTQNLASNGATPTSNNIQFNGIDANNLVENSAAGAQGFEVGTPIPAPDAIQEFRVQTANFDAAYGRGSGANVDLVTKSGTNTFHGSAWEFLRNQIFNANDFFTKGKGLPRAELKQNEFGASLGGPVLRDKTCFFFAYQGITQVSGLGDAHTTTLPLLTADRSAKTLGAQFCPAGNLDSHGQPAAGYITGAGGTQVACDGSNINPVALAILNAKLPNGQFAVPSPQVVLPNSGQNPTDQLPQGQSTFTIPADYREDQYTTDIDHTLSAKNSLAGRFFYSRSTKIVPVNTANVPGWPTDELAHNTNFVLADTYVMNANLLSIARVGFIRFNGISSVASPLTAQEIGQSTPTGIVDSSSTAPALTVGGFSLGDGGTPAQWQVTNSFVYQDTVAYTRGHHNARFGVELKRHEVDENQPQQADGNVQFGSIEDFLIGQSATQNGSPLGLSNVGLSIAGGGIFRKDERYTNLAAFAQDDWKIMQRLTVNAGLRYEIFSAPTERNGRLPNYVPSLAIQGPLPGSGVYNGFTLPSNYHGPVPSGVAITPTLAFIRRRCWISLRALASSGR
jgi:hypothetical protein